MKERERLFDTVEEIRANNYPDLDAGLVRDLLNTQIRMQEDRAEARHRTEQTITRWAAANAAPATGEDA